jgi:hypothetical protein
MLYSQGFYVVGQEACQPVVPCNADKAYNAMQCHAGQSMQGGKLTWAQLTSFQKCDQLPGGIKVSEVR